MFEYYCGKDFKWYWRFVAKNGRKIADGGQGYASKANIKRAILEFHFTVSQVGFCDLIQEQMIEVEK